MYYRLWLGSGIRLPRTIPLGPVFEGSCNFSKTALVDNIESFTVSCDWDGVVSQANIYEIEPDFNNTFNGNDQSVDYLQIEDIKTQISDSFGNKDIEMLLKDEKDIIDNQFH